jgi:hypothetical protein
MLAHLSLGAPDTRAGCRGVEYTKASTSDQTVRAERDIASFTLAVPGALWYHVVGHSPLRRWPLSMTMHSYDTHEILLKHSRLWQTFEPCSPYQAGDISLWLEHYCGRSLAAKMTAN